MSSTPTMGASNSASGVAMRAENSRLRARWLTKVASGEDSPLDVIAACANGGPALEPLRRLQIKVLLSAQPDWGPKRVRQTISLLRRWCDVKPELATKDMTVSWMLDGKVKGARFRALVDAMTPREAPWAGFPHTGDPGGTQWT